MQVDTRIDLVEDSFSKLKVDKIAFAEAFYARLFLQSPQLKPLFAKTDIKQQAKKLYAALVLLVENLRHPIELERVLLPLGERHITYGVTASHYPLVGGALLETLEEFLGAAWTPPVAAAWTETYGAVSQAMLKGAGINVDNIPHVKAQQPGESAPPQDTKDYHLIENSFAIVRPRAKEFAEQFYVTLFKDAPQLEPLFAGTAMSEQAGKLLKSLILLVENIRHPDKVEMLLRPLGDKHKGFGVVEKHYPVVGKALLQTLEEYVGEGWTPDVAKAWRKTYGGVVGMMVGGTAALEPAPTKMKAKAEKTSAPTLSAKKAYSADQSKRAYIGKRSVLTNWFWDVPLPHLALAAAFFFMLLIPLGKKFHWIEDIVNFAEPLSIFLALLLFVREAPSRKKQFHYQAWSTIDGAEGIPSSRARFIAMQDLCDDGVSMKGLKLAFAELGGLEIIGGDLSGSVLDNAILTKGIFHKADLNNTSLIDANATSADFSQANLGFAKMVNGNFSSCDFSGATMMFADLSGGNFSGADFTHANLNGAKFEGAYLSGANLTGANVTLSELEGAFLIGTIMPDGTVHE